MKLMTSNAHLFVLIIWNLIPFQNRNLPKTVVKRNYRSELVVCVRFYHMPVMIECSFGGIL